MDHDQKSKSELLCKDCGICCSGTVLSGVRLEAAEGSFAELHKLCVVKTEEGLAFAQPCPLFTARSCSAYAERPRRCRSFRCKTLRAFEGGTLTEEQSIERINALRKRIESIEATITSESRGALWWAAAHIFDPSTDAVRRAQLSAVFEGVLEQLTEFRGLADKWIASPDDLREWS